MDAHHKEAQELIASREVNGMYVHFYPHFDKSTSKVVDVRKEDGEDSSDLTKYWDAWDKIKKTFAS